MRQTRITYVKRCLNSRCTHKEQCEHGQAQMRFQQHFPKGIEDVPDYMLHMFKAIYPVAYGCPRWQMTREQCIEQQNKEQQKIISLF